MALSPKPAGQAQIKIELPKALPQISPAAFDRVPGLREWWTQMNTFYRDLSAVLMRLQDGVPSITGLATEGSVTTVATNLSESIATVTASLNAMIEAVNAVVAAQAAIEAGQEELASGLAEHIAAHSHVHGVIGDVVGTTDQQSLDSKTIGRAVPGLVRATGLMGANSVKAGIILEIPSDSQAVIAGPFDVFGTLVVSGVVVCV